MLFLFRLVRAFFHAPRPIALWIFTIAFLSIPLTPRVAFCDEDIFYRQTQLVTGRPVQVLAPDLRASAESRGSGLVVVAVSGSPPHERRQLVLWPAEPLSDSPPSSSPVTVEVPSDVVAFDFGDIDTTPGAELVLLSASELQVFQPFADDEPRIIPVHPTLPLPPRTRGLSQLPFLGNWSGQGKPEALVPTLGGAELLSLNDGKRKVLPLPLLTEYLPPDRRPPASQGFLSSTVTWPTIVQADNDGDGRLDLFALSRFAVWIYHAEATGLAREPTHKFDLRLFSPREELRPQTTSARLFAQDLDADGLADLVVHRTAGTLLRSRAATDIYRNSGSGVQPPATPEAQLTVDDGFATIELVDLNSDRRVEILQTRLAFGIMQALRVLATRRAQVELQVFTFTGAHLSNTVVSWSGSVTLRLDFAQGRVDGLFPTAQGDWNGDGWYDLLYGLHREKLAIHLGTAEQDGPGFGSREATQEVPAASDGLVTDRNGDGLDDLVLFDPRDENGAVHVLLNRGHLKGTPLTLRPSFPES